MIPGDLSLIYNSFPRLVCIRSLGNDRKPHTYLSKIVHSCVLKLNALIGFEPTLFTFTAMPLPDWATWTFCARRDLNPHCVGFKSTVSASWTTRTSCTIRERI